MYCTIRSVSVKKMIESLSSFILVASFPHITVYEFYFIIKYVMLSHEIIAGLCPSLRSNNYISSFFSSLSIALSCLCCCFCCCCCDVFRSAFNKVNHLIQKLNRFLVKILFGPKEGIVERFADTYKKDEENEDGNSRLYFRNMEIGHKEISALALLIMVFGLLAAITAWDAYFLDESYVCSEKPDISCFPLPLDDDATTDLNLTAAQEHRITDCAYWNSENVSSRVTFVCFQWVYDSKGVISNTGGLLALFLVTMRIVSSGTLTFLNWAIKKCTHLKNEKKDASCCNKVLKVLCLKLPNLVVGKCLCKVCKSKYEKPMLHYSDAIHQFMFLRRVTLIVCMLLEFSLASSVFISAVNVIQGKNTRIYDFIYNYGNQLLLIFGIFSSLLLLPLEEYAMSGENCEEMPPNVGQKQSEGTPLINV